MFRKETVDQNAVVFKRPRLPSALPSSRLSPPARGTLLDEKVPGLCTSMKVSHPACNYVIARPVVISLEEMSSKRRLKMNRFRVKSHRGIRRGVRPRFGRHCRSPPRRLRPEGTGQLSLLRARRRLDELLFRFLADCAGAGAGRCVENPGFNGGNAMAGATSRRLGHSIVRRQMTDGEMATSRRCR